MRIPIEIFVLDDDSADSEFIERYLRSKGIVDLIVVNDSNEFIDKIKEDSLIFVIDHLLGGNVTGFDMVSLIRKDHPERIIIIVSGQSDITVSLKYHKLKCLYINKNEPGFLEELYQTIREAEGNLRIYFELSKKIEQRYGITGNRSS